MITTLLLPTISRGRAKIDQGRRPNLDSDTIVVEQIINQEPSKVRKRKKSPKQALKPPPYNFAKVVVKKKYSKGNNRVEL